MKQDVGRGEEWNQKVNGQKNKDSSEMQNEVSM